MQTQFDTAIMDGATVGWVAHSLNVNAEVLDFFDVASIIEALIFHEKIQLTFSSKLNDVERTFFETTSSSFKALIESGIVEIITYDEPETNDKVVKKHSKKSKKTKILDADNDFTAWYLHQTVQFAILERNSNGNAIVLPRQSSIYKMNKRVRVEHSICNLYLNYKTTRELAQLARFVSAGKPTNIFNSTEYWSLPIPPICLDVMKNCEKLERIWDIAGDLRDKHKNIRKAHFEFSLNHSNKDLSPAKREKYAKILKKDWNTLISKWKNRIEAFKIADTTQGLRQESGLLSELSGAEISMAGDLAVDPSSVLKWGNLLKSMYEKITGYWRMRKIHDSMEAYWNINDFELYSHISRLLKKDITDSDHQNIVNIEKEDKLNENRVIIVDFFPD